MSKKSNKVGINIFQRYLTIWVFLCMAVGILIGKFLPVIPEYLNKLNIAGISVPIAILIWVMIYPMMMKVDFLRSCSMYCNGFCMEYTYKRKSSIYCCSGSN